MAPIFKTIALAGALFMASTAAAPVEKRAVVWETVTDVVYTTVDVTTTLYPQELVATATVVPVTTTSSDAAAVESTSAKPEEHHQPEPTTTSTSTSTPAPAPEPTQPTTTEQPTTSVAPAPAPEPTTTEPATTEEPTSTSSTVAAPTARASSDTTSSSSGSGSSSSSGYTGTCSKESPCSGQMTYYDTATSASAPSACGTTNDGLTELVLALPVGIMTDSDCGKTVTIEYGGITKTGKVVDKCMGCDNGSLDLSRAFFEVFDSLSAGRLSGAKWYIN